MNWYIAKMVFNITSGDGDHIGQFDEQYRLIKAETMEVAFQKAQRIGINEQEMLWNDKHEIVRWDFVDVSELYPVNELQDGMELFSAIHEEKDRDTYIATLKLKSAYVQNKFDVVRENA